MENIELVHKLLQEMGSELNIHFKKYMDIHKKVFVKINAVEDPYNLSREDKDELRQLLMDLISSWHIIQPVMNYFIDKYAMSLEIIKLHRDLTDDLNMDWFK